MDSLKKLKKGEYYTVQYDVPALDNKGNKIQKPHRIIVKCLESTSETGWKTKMIKVEHKGDTLQFQGKKFIEQWKVLPKYK